MNKKATCSIIIVTHNSELHIPKAVQCAQSQTTPPKQIIIVDSGSKDCSYLTPYMKQNDIEVIIAQKDIGFCKGNNIGMSKVKPSTDYVFFLNPDAFLTPTFLEHAIDFMELPQNANVGALTGIVLGYDIHGDKPTGKYDSTGVFRKWYGNWYDRDQGDVYSNEKYKTYEDIPAICGAVLFCRKKALDSVLIRKSEVLDNSFFMYKEDIDLSIRLRKNNWKLIFFPKIIAYHCRGWQRDRSKMPRELRLVSARNELRIQAKTFSPIPLAYSLVKYAAVKFLDL